MAKLDNARHELFAQGLAEGETADAAYSKAGYKTNRKNASRLKSNEDIQARVTELQGKAAKQAVTTTADIARQLDEDREFARGKDAPSAAVQATMGKAKVLGLIVDKHRVGMKNIDDMSEDELRDFLGKAEKEPGDDA